MNCYEIYVYLDPRKPGTYTYGDICFSFCPVYVGKGSIKWKRKYIHLKRSNNKRLRNLMHTLSIIKLQPVIQSIIQNISEKEALLKEKQIISMIGRKDLNTGPLYNFTDGGEGCSGAKYTLKQLQNRSENTKKYFQSLTPEQLKEHGKKSLQNRSKNNILAGKISRKITNSNKSVKEKQDIEARRYSKWRQSISTHTSEKKLEISNKCKFASKQLRKQYYIKIKNLTTNEIKTQFLNDWLADGFARDGIMDRIKSNSTNSLYSRTIKQWVQIISWVKISPALIV